MMPTIRDLRQARKWSQMQLAQQVGVTMTTVYRWERGDYAPRADQLRTLANVFEVPMEQIDLLPKRKTPAPERTGAGSASSESAEEAETA